MATEIQPPVPSVPIVRHFAPTHSCGGLVAAVGIVFATGLGFTATLPGSPIAPECPIWLIWVLRLTPLPAIVLLWAVVSEAEFKVRTDHAAIYFRGLLGQVTRIPWEDLHDFFADCGRRPQAVVSSGGSMVHEGSPNDDLPPFHDHRPDYVLVSGRVLAVFNDAIARVGLLASEVAAHAPPEAPRRWEEASWVQCPSCKQRFAVSLWPWSGVTEPLDRFACPACSDPWDALVDDAWEGFVVQLRGRDRRCFAWRPPTPIAQQPQQPGLDVPEGAAPRQPPQESPDETE